MFLCGKRIKKMIIKKKYLNHLTYEVIGAAIEVHKHLGPGLLESVYHKCMIQELKERDINFQSEVKVPINYKGLDLETQLRCDLLIENILPIELKSTEKTIPIHKAQIITYMNLLKVPKGILINFNVNNIFKEGQQTFVNELFRELPE